MPGLAATLVRLYPKPWRERYGAEMVEMLRDERLTLRTATDLVAGAIDARVNPQRRPEPSGLGQGAGTMTRIFRCAPAGVTMRDQWRSAGWMLGGTIGLLALGMLVRQLVGPNAFSESVVLSAFPASLMLSNECLYFKPYSRTVRTVLSFGGAAFIVLLIWAAAALEV